MLVASPSNGINIRGIGNQGNQERLVPRRQIRRDGYIHVKEDHPDDLVDQRSWQKRSSSVQNREHRMLARKELVKAGVVFAEPAMCATNQLHKRPKDALQQLEEEGGLTELAYLILHEAVNQEDPPEPVKSLARYVFEELKAKNLISSEVRMETSEMRSKCLRLIPAKREREGTPSYLLALFHHLLSKGKQRFEDLQKKADFEFLISSLCLQIDPKLCQYSMVRGTSNSENKSGTHCFLLRKESTDNNIQKPRCILICVCEYEDVQVRTNESEDWCSGEKPLPGVQHEVQDMFELGEMLGVKVLLVTSWDDLQKFQNQKENDIDLVFVTGHTDRKGPHGDAVLALNGVSKPSKDAARAFCAGKAPPQLVVLNGCNSLSHAQALLEHGVQHIVCWETPVSDSEATVFGKAFIHELTKQASMDIVQALKNVPGLFSVWGCPASALCATEPPIDVEDDSCTSNADQSCGHRAKRRRIDNSTANDVVIAKVLQEAEEVEVAKFLQQKEVKKELFKSSNLSPAAIETIIQTEEGTAAPVLHRRRPKDDCLLM